MEEDKTKKFTERLGKVKEPIPDIQVEAQSDDEIIKLKEERDKLTNHLKLLAADFDNYRKRAAKELEENSKYAISKFAKDIIEVLENLYRAEQSINVEALTTDTNLKQIFEGVELTKKCLIDAFEKYNIARVNPLGEQFNPDLHQAIMQVPSTTHEDGEIVQVIQAGYTIYGRIIRPALVAVAKKNS